MTPTTPTTPTWPRLPEFAPRDAAEPAEAYGLRALAFVTAHEVTATVPTDALALADHVYGCAISGRDLAPQAAVRLAEVHRLVTAALRGRQAAETAAPVPEGTQAPPAPTADAPEGGQPAPRPSAPVRPTPPAQARPVPVTGPAALPASQTGISPALATRQAPAAPAAPAPWILTRHGVQARPVAQVTGAAPAAPAAPPLSAAEWGF